MLDSNNSVQEPAVVGLPDTGASVNESACPFDLESPQKVWIGNVLYNFPIGHPIGFTGCRVFATYPTLADAWEFRARCSDCIQSVGGDPVQVLLEDAFTIARERGHKKLIVRLGTGRVIEEYPL